jgi:hypothetical protein
MFDYIIYKDKHYQTRDTPEQGLETYEIRGGELWYREVQREWEDDEETFFGGYFREVSHEWKFCDKFDGLVRFYREDKENGGHKNDAWIEFSALFMNGKVIKFERMVR